MRIQYRPRAAIGADLHKAPVSGAAVEPVVVVIFQGCGRVTNRAERGRDECGQRGPAALCITVGKIE